MEKKTLGWILFAAAVIALILIVIFRPPHKGLPNTTEQPSETALAILKSEDKKVDKETENLSIHVTYPAYEGVPELINSDIKSFVDEEVAILEDLPAGGMPDSVVTKYSLQADYETEQANTDYVSLVFTVDEYTGGAHPNEYFRTFNYNVDTGTEMTLADLYPGEEKYLEKLKPKIKAAVHEKVADDMLFDDIQNLDAAAFEHFTFGDTYIKFFFSPYDIAPYVAGPIVVQVER
jgi:hypothetical protein